MSTKEGAYKEGAYIDERGHRNDEIAIHTTEHL